MIIRMPFSAQNNDPSARHDIKLFCFCFILKKLKRMQIQVFQVQAKMSDQGLMETICDKYFVTGVDTGFFVP